MTSEEAIKHIENIKPYVGKNIKDALDVAIKALEKEYCDNVISRKAVIDLIVANHTELNGLNVVMYSPLYTDIKQLPPVLPQPKVGRCKDCKWWKDSDGHYRRGIRAESQCPMNREEVYKGNGYCYMFEPQESEEQEEREDKK